MTGFIFLIAVGAIIALYFLGARKKVAEKPIQFRGPHDCGMRALQVVLPHLSAEKIENAFMNCADKWPRGGVTNVEFNVALRFMGLFDQFEYNDADGQKLGDFLDDEDSATILLIHGHFTTVKEGKIIDMSFVPGAAQQKVYCSWRLTSQL